MPDGARRAIPDDRRGSGLRRAAVPLAGGLISLAAVVVAANGIDLNRTIGLLGQVRPGPLVVASAALVVQLLVRAERWSLLLPSGPDGRVAARRLVPVVLIGYLGNAVLPARLGDPIRAILVGRREAIPTSAAFGSVVLERAIDTLSLALIAVPAAIAAGAPTWAIETALVVAVIATTVVAGAQTPIPAAIVDWLGRRVSRALRSWVASAGRFAAAMNGRRHPGALVGAGGLSIVAWLLDGITYWSVAQSLGIDLSPAAAMFVAAITVLGTAIPAAPGYIGTFELAASAAARSLGVAPEQALAFALLVHVLTVLPLAIGGALSLVWIGARFGDLAGSVVPGSVTGAAAGATEARG
jgi:glycosyltransferase 2 family protein